MMRRSVVSGLRDPVVGNGSRVHARRAVAHRHAEHAAHRENGENERERGRSQSSCHRATVPSISVPSRIAATGGSLHGAHRCRPGPCAVRQAPRVEQPKRVRAGEGVRLVLGGAEGRARCGRRWALQCASTMLSRAGRPRDSRAWSSGASDATSSTGRRPPPGAMAVLIARPRQTGAPRPTGRTTLDRLPRIHSRTTITAAPVAVAARCR